MTPTEYWQECIAQAAEECCGIPAAEASGIPQQRMQHYDD